MAKAEEVKVEDQVETPVEGAEGLEEGAGGPESISLNDLQLLAQIVDLASQRGAFRGAELTQVGTIFDKLNAFLGFVAEQQAANADGEEGEGEPEAPAEGE